MQLKLEEYMEVKNEDEKIFKMKKITRKTDEQKPVKMVWPYKTYGKGQAGEEGPNMAKGMRDDRLVKKTDQCG